MSDPNAVYRRVSQAFEENYGLIWLDPLGFDNTYALTMRGQQARELGIETVSDLAEHLRSGEEPVLRAGFNAEFLRRQDGYPGVKEVYGLAFAAEPKMLESGVMYKACADGDVDVICGFATDGRIAAFDLVTLEDDKSFFPPYYAAPLVRKETLEKFPELREVLNLLAGRISDDEMRQMNYEVDENGREAIDVAREFLLREGLLEAR
jgi:glycine betaine/choline ABC-type transport system substrate-binding protein